MSLRFEAGSIVVENPISNGARTIGDKLIQVAPIKLKTIKEIIFSNIL